MNLKTIQMIKKIIVVAVLFFTCISYGQETKKENFHEVKLNGLMLVVGGFEATYERTINEESAFGISALIPYDTEDISLNYYVSPYYRVYFGKKYAAGFFLEGFGMLSSEDTLSSISVIGNTVVGNTEAVTDFAVGIGVGGKWVTNKGFVAELNLGIGRNLFNADRTGSEAVGKVGITIGYRF